MKSIVLKPYTSVNMKPDKHQCTLILPNHYVGMKSIDIKYHGLQEDASHHTFVRLSGT